MKMTRIMFLLISFAVTTPLVVVAGLCLLPSYVFLRFLSWFYDDCPKYVIMANFTTPLVLLVSSVARNTPCKHENHKHLDTPL